MKKRFAFTLLELLLVIAIMAVLLTLTAGAVIHYLGSQEMSNTQTVLDRTQSVLQRQWSEVKDQAYKEQIPLGAQSWLLTSPSDSPTPLVMTGTAADTNASGRMRVIWVKLRLRQAFPMTINEALYTPTIPINGVVTPCPGLEPLPSYVRYLGSYGIGMGTGFSWESSACLLMALQRGPGGVDISTLTSGGAGGVDTDGHGVPVLTDAWKRPIYFSRCPWGCPTLNPSGPQSGLNDTLDPQGYLTDKAWIAKCGGIFTSLTQQPVVAGGTFALKPLVASGGPGTAHQAVLNPVSLATVNNGSPLYAR
jgi:prepilin-type N-terminal cleavage/methylation domain-containing protein